MLGNVTSASQFSVKSDKEQKLRFAFRIYDMDRDGFISNGELFQVSYIRHADVTLDTKYCLKSTRRIFVCVRNSHAL